MSIIVYHGGTDKIEHPLVDAGRTSLDRGSSAGCFWSATINAAKPSNANYLIVELNAKPEVGVMTQTERYFGFNIRAVHE